MNNVKLTYLGHACFKVESDNYSIILDPYKGIKGFNDVEGECNEVLCSHDHFDHAYTDKLNITKKQSPFNIKTIQSYHDDNKGSERGLNTITVISRNNINIVHLGDLGHTLDSETLEFLKDTTVLLIPTGGKFTIDSSTAFKVIEQVNPKYIIPMHYKDGDKGLDVLEDINSFINKADSFKNRLKLIRGYNQTLEL